MFIARIVRPDITYYLISLFCKSLINFDSLFKKAMYMIHIRYENTSKKKNSKKTEISIFSYFFAIYEITRVSLILETNQTWKLWQ